MASQAQIDANRRNAQSSTGPKSPEGKATVAGNALKHGLRSNIYKKPMEGDSEYFDQLLADLIAEHQPQTITEEFYVERMVLCLDKLALLEDMQNDCQFVHSRQLDLSEEKALNIYWNQQERLERAFDRALANLRKLQKERRAEQQNAVPGQTAEPAPARTGTPSQPTAEPIRGAAPAASPKVDPKTSAPFKLIPEKLAS